MVVESKSKYNDGRWHTVEIARDRKIGQVKVIRHKKDLSTKPKINAPHRSIKKWRDNCKVLQTRATA